MSVNVLKVFEYSLICDCCGVEEVLHTGDYDSQNDIFVHNIITAVKCSGFHKTNGQLLCNDCFINRKE